MKRLIFRLSSLGDLILSQSILAPPYVGRNPLGRGERV